MGTCKPAAQTWFGCLCGAALVVASSTGFTQTETLPAVEFVRDAGVFAEEKALFGFNLAMGKLGAATDAFDDLVVCAPKEDLNPHAGPLAVGAAYAFLDDELQLAP